MIIARDHSARVRLVIIFSIFTIVTIIDWATPLFETWNSRYFDNLFTLRSSMNVFAPVYDDMVVHIDLDDTSIQQLQNYYLDRSHHARLITNLTKMGVYAQLHDVIFAAPADPLDDAALVEAVRNSKNIYFGLVFRLSSGEEEIKEGYLAPDVESYLTKSSWSVESKGVLAEFYHGTKPLITVPKIARESSGLGFLNLTADHDGVFRKIPLLVRYRGAFYPSAPFRLICDYLGVHQSNIIIEPGKAITLLSPEKPGGEASERIVIPIDSQGNMVINFIGPWDRLKHYHFSDVLSVSEDQAIWERWVEELSNKIVVISEVTTGSTDVGTVPTDIAYPLSGVSASVIHTILSESFIHETPFFVTLIVQTLVLCGVFLLSLLSSALVFTFSSLGVVFLLLISSALLFLNLGIITSVITPIIMVLVAYFAIQIVRALDNARSLRQSELERSIFEREMEIGRQIQAGFFPEKLPNIPGWELSAFFRPTYQVSGDFYDAFTIANGRLFCFVVADVCDKGVGAALFMALTRSLLRAFTLQNFDHNDSDSCSVAQELKKTIQFTNDYIAQTHGRANMFATLFIGVLNPGTGRLNYINCGHEPPVVYSKSDETMFLMPTGPALGMFPGLEFETREIELYRGYMLLVFTDGVTDAQNDTGEQFSKQKVLECLADCPKSADALSTLIVQKIEEHVSEAKQFDDITLMTLKRIN